MSNIEIEDIINYLLDKDTKTVSLTDLMNKFYIDEINSMNSMDNLNIYNNDLKCKECKLNIDKQCNIQHYIAEGYEYENKLTNDNVLKSFILFNAELTDDNTLSDIKKQLQSKLEEYGFIIKNENENIICDKCNEYHTIYCELYCNKCKKNHNNEYKYCDKCNDCHEFYNEMIYCEKCKKCSEHAYDIIKYCNECNSCHLSVGTNLMIYNKKFNLCFNDFYYKYCKKCNKIHYKDINIYCKKCNKCHSRTDNVIHNENHCKICNKCSKYEHCKICNKCHEQIIYKHCDKCKKCFKDYNYVKHTKIECK